MKKILNPNIEIWSLWVDSVEDFVLGISDLL